MFGFFFTKGPVNCFEDVTKADTAKFGRFHRGMLERGVYLAPSAYEVTHSHLSMHPSGHTTGGQLLCCATASSPSIVLSRQCLSCGGASRFHHIDLKPCSATFWLTFQSALQAGFTSLAHTDADVEHTIQAARETFAEI